MKRDSKLSDEQWRDLIPVAIVADDHDVEMRLGSGAEIKFPRSHLPVIIAGLQRHLDSPRRPKELSEEEEDEMLSSLKWEKGQFLVNFCPDGRIKAYGDISIEPTEPGEAPIESGRLVVVESHR